MNGNPERTNTILGTRFELVASTARVDGWVRESIGGAEIFFPPAAFGQSHLQLADVLVARIHDFVGTAERVSECYAGCGSIGLGLAAGGAWVAFNEQNPAGIAGLRRGIEELGARDRTSVSPGGRRDCLEILDGAEVVIVDPPRKGLDAPLLRALGSAGTARLAYLSCGLGQSRTRHRSMVGGSRLRLRSLEPFALFPFTEHVETLALLEPS